MIRAKKELIEVHLFVKDCVSVAFFQKFLPK